MIGGVSKMLPKRELGKVFHRRRSVCVWGRGGGGEGGGEEKCTNKFLKGRISRTSLVS